MEDSQDKTLQDFNSNTEIKEWIEELVSSNIRKKGPIQGRTKSALAKALITRLKKYKIEDDTIIQSYKNYLIDLIKEASRQTKLQISENPIEILDREKEIMDKDKKPIFDFIKDTYSTLSSVQLSRDLFSRIDQYHDRAVRVIKIKLPQIDYNALINLDGVIYRILNKIDNKRLDTNPYDEILPRLKEFTVSFETYREGMLIILAEILGQDRISGDFTEKEEKSK